MGNFLINKKNAGQTSVEYLLMLGVVVVLVFSVRGKIVKYLDDGKAECALASKSIRCKMVLLYQSNGFDQSTGFRYYRVR